MFWSSSALPSLSVTHYIHVFLLCRAHVSDNTISPYNAATSLFYISYLLVVHLIRPNNLARILNTLQHLAPVSYSTYSFVHSPNTP